MPNEDDIVRAFNLAGNALALAQGASPARLARDLTNALAAEGLAVMTPDARTARDALQAAYDALETTADSDLIPLRIQLRLALNEVQNEPLVFQSFALAALGAGTLIVLALIAKLKVKDGKWELKEGLPGFQHLAKIFPAIFGQNV